MKNFLFAVSILISITIVSCSDSGTGPDPTNEETPTYNVSVSVNPSDGGSISPSADSTYEDGEQIELEANPNDGYLFTGWSGDIDSTKNNPLSLTVDQNYSIKANFELKNYELTINTKGEGSVSEEVLEQKSKDYEYGTVVQLTASPAEGYKFVEWQGDVTGTENPKEITIDNPKSVTAIFEKKTFPLTINISGNGTVTRNPDQTEYKYGALVDLSTTPETDWEFETWDGDTVSTSKLITVRMDSAITVTAVFNNTTFAGGNGSDAYPFEIATPEQLQSINDFKDANYILVNNIDATETKEWYSGKGFKPIGNVDNRFTGSFDGNGYKITNLYIDRITEDRIGLFGAIDEATIKNITLENIDISGGDFVGGLVGTTTRNPSITQISNVQISGSVTGQNYVGGLIGFFTGTISNSSSTGSVEGGRWFGGLVGRSRGDEIKSSYSESNVLRRFTSSNVMGGLIGDNYGTLVRDSYASGNVEGRNDLGGLIGINYAEGTILNSYSNSKVTGYSGSSISADRVGGLVGNNQGEINNSQAYGDVNSQGMEIGGLVGINSGNIFDSQAEGNISTDDNSAGGLVGNNQGIIETSTSSGNVSSDVNSGGFAGNNSGQIINSYSLGDSGGNKNVGGFIGKISLNGEVKNCFSTGLVTGSENIGGLIGINEEVSNITGSYWDIEQTGQSDGVGYGNSSDSKGLTTSQMTGPAAKDNMTAFDWAEKWVTTDSYPALSWE